MSKVSIERLFKPIFDRINEAITVIDIIKPEGVVLEVSGNVIKSNLVDVNIGEVCIICADNNRKLLAEVIGFGIGYSLLLPLDEVYGVSTASTVVSTGSSLDAPVGNELLGRVIDGFGVPIDGKGNIRSSRSYPIIRKTPAPMERPPISSIATMGINAIDGLLTIGKGQRIGIFANAGVGKTTLLASIIKRTAVKIAVVALIGERGREVREFIEHNLGPEGLQKTVVICTTSDKPPLEIARSAFLATSIAEFFRDQGKDVLLMMDSLTRFCRARRSIGLAAGEPPTRRGYPPSVFDILPKLLERVGNNKKGSITGIYTVLVEGDEGSDPVAEEVRSILDGHIVLSRELAAINHYPAIDVNMSISRVMNNIVSDEHRELASKFRDIIAKYKDSELLIKIGEYKRGSDPASDYAIDRYDMVNNFLKQVQDDEIKTLEGVIQGMREIIGA